jgi:hypothetical protein
MDVMPGPPGFDDVLFVLVTCALEESRSRVMADVVASLNREHARTGMNRNLVVFDNGSIYKEHLADIEDAGCFAMSPTNIGYWSAIHWVLQNSERLLGRRFAYVHPLESDLIVYGTENLSRGVEFLADYPEIATVRTQEFELAHKRRYFKGSFGFMKQKRSWVASYNGATNEPVWFKSVPGHPAVAVTNWHSKVPALHRYESLKWTFEELSDLKQVSELLFMQIMHRRWPHVGVLDHGIWHINDGWTQPTKLQVHGSWSSSEQLEKIGYRQTRVDRIEQPQGQIAVVKCLAH